MPGTVILGAQWGDEGKGGWADLLAPEFDVVARAQGGPNAGHTVVLPDGEELDFHGLPSGVAHENVMNVIGNGTVVHPVKLWREILELRNHGIHLEEDRLLISSAAHLITPLHVHKDTMREAGPGAQGSTKSGIAYAYADKALRVGKRMESINHSELGLAERITEGLEEMNDDLRTINKLRAADLMLDRLPLYDVSAETELYLACAQKLGPFVTDTTLFLNDVLKNGGSILAEGAQAYGLDIDHGTYPDTTSAATSIGGVIHGLGIPAQAIERVINVVKLTPSRVGNGPLLTEIPADSKLAEALRGSRDAVDGEYGTTTGRMRRMGYLDLPPIRRANMANGATEMVVTKLDKIPEYGAKVLVSKLYTRKGKQDLPVAPDAAYKVKESTPQYVELPTWRKDISGIRRFKDLPPNARKFIQFIEEQTEVRVSMIGVGPRRDQVIVRN